MSTFTIAQNGGDSAGVNDNGSTIIVNTSNNYQRINSQPVPHNSAVVATTAPGTTPGDVTIYASPTVYTEVVGIILKCTLSNLNGNVLIPQVYVKLVGAHGSSHDLVIPMVPGQIFTWLNPAATINGINNVNQPNNTYDANGAAYTLETGAAVMVPVVLSASITSITVCPDKYSDVSISGTVELAV